MCSQNEIHPLSVTKYSKESSISLIYNPFIHSYKGLKE